MTNNQSENHPKGYTSREQAFADARFAIAKLCEQDRSSGYKAAVMEAIQAIDAVAAPSAKPEIALVSDDALWSAAVAEIGTSKAPPYGFPVIVLPRPRDVAAVFRAMARCVGMPVAQPMSEPQPFDEATPHC
jgi:hypothetical protein